MDRRYLQRRGQCWYLRVPNPPGFWGKKGELVHTLRTPDLRIAQQLRDRYLTPLLAETAAAEFLSALTRLAAAARESVTRQLDGLPANLSGREPVTLTLRAAADAYLRYLRAPGTYAPASLRKVASSLDALCHVLGPDFDVNRLSKADAVRFRDTALALPAHWQNTNDRSVTPAKPGERRLSGRSVATHLMYGKALFRWLRDEGKTTRPDNPFQDVTVARLSSKQKRAPSAAEVEALMILPRPRGLDATAWRAMPLLGRYTGCRAGELAQLRAEDVIVEQGIRCLAIRGDGGERRLKTASSQRLVPVAAKINILLDELVAAHPSGPLLETGTFRGADGIVKGAHRFLQAFNRAAKRVAGDLSFHCLRVYANDAMATAGVDIGDRERLLGHKSERTQSAYTPENLRRLKAAVDTIP